MARVALALMLAAMAGMYWGGDVGDDHHPAPLNPTVGSEQELPATALSRQSEIFSPDAASPGAGVTGSLNEASGATDLRQVMTQATGRELRHVLEAFWLRCNSLGNCSDRLSVLQGELSAERYALLADYPAMNDAWQHTLGELDLAQSADITEQVAQVKAQARAVWGPEAEQLFADMFALYDFRLESRTLAASSPEQFTVSYQQLVAKWQHQSDALALESNAGRYEHAVSLIPAHYTASQKQQVSAQLAQLYLSDSEQAAIEQRQQQVEQQAQQVRDYQLALSQLKQTLAHQRATTYASMPEAQWQSYSQQQVANFRQDFFAQ